jgi:hypothetical protein
MLVKENLVELRFLEISSSQNVGAGLREARELGKRLGRQDWGLIARDVASCWPPWKSPTTTTEEQHDSKRAASATSAVLAL